MRYNAKGFCSGELHKKEIVKKSVAANFEVGFPCFSSLWPNRAVLPSTSFFLGWGEGRGDPILTFDMKLFYLFFFLPPFFISLLHSFLTSFCFRDLFLYFCLFLVFAVLFLLINSKFAL